MKSVKTLFFSLLLSGLGTILRDSASCPWHLVFMKISCENYRKVVTLISLNRLNKMLSWPVYLPFIFIPVIYLNSYNYINKRPNSLNGHLSIRDFTLNSCQKGAYLHINSPIVIINKNQQLYRKQHSNLLTQ